MPNSLIYLASPYASPSKEVVEDRVRRVTLVAANLVKQGMFVYSPIVHGHQLHLAVQLPKTWEFWSQIDLAFIRRCDELWVLTLPGWKSSIGVRAEVDYALEHLLPVWEVDEKLSITTFGGFPSQ